MSSFWTPEVLLFVIMVLLFIVTIELGWVCWKIDRVT
jgi:hypothetical protein